MRVILYKKPELVKQKEKQIRVLTISDEGDMYRNIAMRLGKKEDDGIDSLWYISQQGYERIEKDEIHLVGN